MRAALCFVSFIQFLLLNFSSGHLPGVWQEQVEASWVSRGRPLSQGSRWDQIRCKLTTHVFISLLVNQWGRLAGPAPASDLTGTLPSDLHVVSAAGIVVDDLIMQLVGLRYTEPDMTISYPGFLYLLLKLENMICEWGGDAEVGQGTVGINLTTLLLLFFGMFCSQVPSIRHGRDGIRNCDLQAGT